MGTTAREKGSGPRLIVNPKAPLFDQIREVMRFHHYAIRTEKAYTQCSRPFRAFSWKLSKNHAC